VYETEAIIIGYKENEEENKKTTRVSVIGNGERNGIRDDKKWS
jgi:hypothetical protein